MFLDNFKCTLFLPHIKISYTYILKLTKSHTVLAKLFYKDSWSQETLWLVWYLWLVQLVWQLWLVWLFLSGYTYQFLVKGRPWLGLVNQLIQSEFKMMIVFSFPLHLNILNTMFILCSHTLPIKLVTYTEHLQIV